VTAPTVITFIGYSRLLSLNDRLHWAQKATLNRMWRKAAHGAAVMAQTPVHGRSLVNVSLPVRNVNQRRDAHNFIATVKPIIDGLVDAGVWPDDNGRYVVTDEPCFHARHLDPFVTITITELP